MFQPSKALHGVTWWQARPDERWRQCVAPFTPDAFCQPDILCPPQQAFLGQVALLLPQTDDLSSSIVFELGCRRVTIVVCRPSGTKVHG